MKTWKPRIGDASAFLKALNDVVFDAPEAGDVLGKDADIVGTRGTGEVTSMFRRQGKVLGRGFELNHAARQQSA